VGGGSSGADGSFSPDRTVDGFKSYNKVATLFIASPSELGDTVMGSIRQKMKEGNDFLFDIDAWKASGLSVQEFIGDKLNGRSFQSAVILGHGNENGFIDRDCPKFPNF
jgi:hypothetical protein